MKSILKNQINSNQQPPSSSASPKPNKNKVSAKRPQGAHSGGRKERKAPQQESKTAVDNHSNQMNNVNYESEGEGTQQISLYNQNT